MTCDRLKSPIKVNAAFRVIGRRHLRYHTIHNKGHRLLHTLQGSLPNCIHVVKKQTNWSELVWVSTVFLRYKWQYFNRTQNGCPILTSENTL
ncbi:hypothetical protein FKM82_015649 [Ascaphus truei]